MRRIAHQVALGANLAPPKRRVKQYDDVIDGADAETAGRENQTFVVATARLATHLINLKK